MRRLLVVNNQAKELEDRARIYLALLKLPVQLEIVSDFATATRLLSEQHSYDLLMAEFPVCESDIAMLKAAQAHQPGMKGIFLSDTTPLPQNTETAYCVVPSSMSISAFYGAMSEMLPDTVSCVDSRSDRWLSNHEALLARILQVLCIIRDNYNEDLSLNYLAEKVFLSPCYLTSLFSKYVGVSPIAYVNDYRMRKAAELLLSSCDTVTAICQTVGYRNLPYFCTCFKNKYSMTPAQYRKANCMDTFS